MDAEEYRRRGGIVLQAANAWIKDHPGRLEANLPTLGVFVAGLLDDKAIRLIAKNAYTIEFLQELERAGEAHGGTTVMMAVDILRYPRRR